MKANVIPLEAEKFYHIYNRGIDGCQIFKKSDDYQKFLEKYAHHIEPIADTYAYCLLGNHFHFLVRIKSEEEIYQKLPYLAPKKFSNAISSQFGHLFNGYAQYFNLSIGRTGGLFDHPYKRKVIESDSYFSQMIYYIHSNPQKHGLIADFRDYSYSSYHSHLSNKNTLLKRGEVVSWFGDKQTYQVFHGIEQNLDNVKDLMIEFD
jgi:REP element-mobilizing transposase RayT